MLLCALFFYNYTRQEVICAIPLLSQTTFCQAFLCTPCVKNLCALCGKNPYVPYVSKTYVPYVVKIPMCPMW
jgi:hypothetical protein